MSMGSQASIVSRDRIEYGLWLIFDDKGGVRMARLRPSIERDERAVALSVTLPTSIFKTPELRVSLTIPDGATSIPPIDISATTEALRNVIGCDIDVRVVEPS
jgi:hypothetical protein